MIQPYSMADDLRGEAMAVVGVRWRLHADSSSAPARPPTVVTVTMPTRPLLIVTFWSALRIADPVFAMSIEVQGNQAGMAGPVTGNQCAQRHRSFSTTSHAVILTSNEATPTRLSRGRAHNKAPAEYGHSGQLQLILFAHVAGRRFSHAQGKLFPSWLTRKLRR